MVKAWWPCRRHNGHEGGMVAMLEVRQSYHGRQEESKRERQTDRKTNFQTEREKVVKK